MLYFTNHEGNANQNCNHRTSARIAYYQKDKIQVLAKVLRKGNSINLLLELVQPLWFLKKLKIQLPYALAIPLPQVYIPRKGKEVTPLKEITPSHVHCSIIYNNQNVETTLHNSSMYEQSEKFDMYTCVYICTYIYIVHTYIGILSYIHRHTHIGILLSPLKRKILLLQQHIGTLKALC